MEVFINKINKTSSCEGSTGWLAFVTACSALYVRLLAGEFGSAIDLYMYTVYIYRVAICIYIHIHTQYTHTFFFS